MKIKITLTAQDVQMALERYIDDVIFGQVEGPTASQNLIDYSLNQISFTELDNFEIEVLCK